MHIKQQTCDQQLHFFSLLQVIFDPLLPSVQDLIFPPPPLPQPSVTGTHSWHSDEESVLEKGLPQLLAGDGYSEYGDGDGYSSWQKLSYTGANT